MGGLKGLRGLRLIFTGVSAAESISGAGTDPCCSYRCDSGSAGDAVSYVIMVKVWIKSGLKKVGRSNRGFK